MTSRLSSAVLARVPFAAATMVAAAASLSLAAGAAEQPAGQAAGQAAGKSPAPAPANAGDVKTIAPAIEREPADADRAAAAAQPGIALPHAAKPAMAPAHHAIDFSQVHYSQPGDGSIWALGKNYKAQFSASGVTFVPFLGSDAPRNFPVSLQIQNITSGGKTLALAAGQPVRSGDRIVIDHGIVQEVYLLTPDSVEQEFTFAANPGRQGDLAINLAVSSDLAGQDLGDSLRFGDAQRGVSYSKAITVDAAARHTAAPTTLQSGSGIKIAVPHATLASAAYPLTVDPIIATYNVDNASIGFDRSADIAYDSSVDSYGIVWEHNFSNADGDIYSERYNYDGTPDAGTFAVIDSTTVNWRNPKIADNKLNANFLVVAEVGNAPSRSIWGAIRNAGDTTVGAQFQISDPSSSGDKLNPDVGGDPNGTAPVYFLVVWERNLSAGDHDIHGRLVTPGGANFGDTIFIDNSGATVDITPSVSKTDGAVDASFQDWIVVWDRANVATDHDIYGARIHWDGSITSGTFGVDTSGSDNRNPAASTILDSNQNYMVVYEESPNGIADIWGRVFSGTTIVGSDNLTSLENIETSAARRQPAIDSTLDKFVVAYGEQFNGSDWDGYVSTYCFDGGSIRVGEQHRILDFDNEEVSGLQVSTIHSATGGTFASSESQVIWANLSGALGDIRGGFYKAKVTCCVSDVTANGTTDIDDLLTVINGWGTCPTFNCPADVNGDAEVDIDDLLAVINGWGLCP